MWHLFDKLVEILLLVGDVNTTLPTDIVSGKRILENYVMKIESNKIDASQSDSSYKITLPDCLIWKFFSASKCELYVFLHPLVLGKEVHLEKKLAENYILAPHGFSWLFQSCQFFNNCVNYQMTKKGKKKKKNFPPYMQSTYDIKNLRCVIKYNNGCSVAWLKSSMVIVWMKLNADI